MTTPTQDTASSSLAALSSGLADAVERAGRAVVAVNARPRIPASAVHWREGVVVASSHTVRRDENITVTLGDGRTVPATLAGRDAGTDLCVLRLDGAGAPTADVGDTAALRVGQLVVAIGRPGTNGVTAALGMVSGLGPAWRTWSGGRIDQLVRLDLAIYDGFSGGPLVDLAGRVVGLNTSALARGAPTTIPTATVTRVVDQLLARGHVARGYLGVGMQPVRLPASLVSKLSLASDAAVMAVSVDPDGPADRAGLLIGDIVLSLAGEAVPSTEAVLGVLQANAPGASLAARIVRGGETRDVALVVGERPRRER